MKHQRRRPGFTLIEVLLVLAILGVIAAIVVPQMLGRQQEAMKKATRTSIAGLENTLKLYAIDHDGEFPAGTRDEVFALLLNPGADASGEPRMPYLENMPADAWGEVLFYEYPNSKSRSFKPAIWSSGRNKQNEEGAGDDITNWQVVR